MCLPGVGAWRSAFTTVVVSKDCFSKMRPFSILLRAVAVSSAAARLFTKIGGLETSPRVFTTTTYPCFKRCTVALCFDHTPPVAGADLRVASCVLGPWQTVFLAVCFVRAIVKTRRECELGECELGDCELGIPTRTTYSPQSKCKLALWAC